MCVTAADAAAALVSLGGWPRYPGQPISSSTRPGLAGDHPPGPDPSMGGPNGGSGAYAIRALPGLCLGIVSGRLGD
jgi:hypothetical protein